MIGDETDSIRLESIPGPSRPARYDLVLLIIPVAFFVALWLSITAPISERTALAVASMIGGVALLDGLFLNPPRGPETAPAS